jgi:hypothetical protein
MPQEYNINQLSRSFCFFIWFLSFSNTFVSHLHRNCFSSSFTQKFQSLLLISRIVSHSSIPLKIFQKIAIKKKDLPSENQLIPFLGHVCELSTTDHKEPITHPKAQLAGLESSRQLALPTPTQDTRRTRMQIPTQTTKVDTAEPVLVPHMIHRSHVPG